MLEEKLKELNVFGTYAHEYFNQFHPELLKSEVSGSTLGYLSTYFDFYGDNLVCPPLKPIFLKEVELINKFDNIVILIGLFQSVVDHFDRLKGITIEKPFDEIIDKTLRGQVNSLILQLQKKLNIYYRKSAKESGYEHAPDIVVSMSQNIDYACLEMLRGSELSEPERRQFSDIKDSLYSFFKIPCKPFNYDTVQKVLTLEQYSSLDDILLKGTRERRRELLDNYAKENSLYKIGEHIIVNKKIVRITKVTTTIFENPEFLYVGFIVNKKLKLTKDASIEFSEKHITGRYEV